MQRYNRRRRVGSYTGVGPQIARILGRTIRNRITSRRNVSRTQPNEQARHNPDNALTDHYDMKTDYRRKRMTPRAKKRLRRTKRFARRVESATLRNTMIPSSVCQERLFTVSAVQSYHFHALMNTSDGYFAGPDAANPSADWREFFREGSAANQQAWDNAVNIVTGGTNVLNPAVGRRYRQLLYHSCVVEMTVRNTGDNPCIVNCYRVVCRRSVPSQYGNIVNLYTEGFERAGLVSEDPLTGSSAWDAQYSANALCATPFQSQLFVRHFKILRRTKYELSPGQFFSILLKDTRRRHVNMTTMITKMAVAGFTQGYFFDFNGVPADIGAPTTTTSQLTVSILRKYRISFLPQKMYQTSLDVTD